MQQLRAIVPRVAAVRVPRRQNEMGPVPYTQNPAVRKTVRCLVNMTGTTNLTNDNILLADATDYLPAASSGRYQSIRVHGLKVWNTSTVELTVELISVHASAISISGSDQVQDKTTGMCPFVHLKYGEWDSAAPIASSPSINLATVSADAYPTNIVADFDVTFQ